MRLHQLWREHPGLDWGGAAVITAVATVLGPGWLGESSHRAELYTTVIASTATLFGFVAAGLTIIQGVGDGPRITALRERHGVTINRTMLAMLRSLALLLAVAVFALATESAEPNRGVIAAVSLVLVLNGLRFTRILWLLAIVLGVHETDREMERIEAKRQTPRSRAERGLT